MISDPAFFMPNFFSILTLGSGKCKHNFFAHLFKMTYLVLTKKPNCDCLKPKFKLKLFQKNNYNRYILFLAHNFVMQMEQKNKHP